MDEIENKQQLAQRFGIKQIEDLFSYPFVQNKIRVIPYGFARSKLALPLDQQGKELLVAVSDPADLEVLKEMRFMTGLSIKEVYAPAYLLEEAIERCYHQTEKEASEYFQGLEKDIHASNDFEEENEYDLLDQKSQSPVIRMLNVILLEAIQQGSSDIHFEPLEETLAVRYRIDGVLQKRHNPPKEYQNQLLTRIKVMAKMDIAEHRLPQDGRIKLRMGGRQIDFRVSTVPVAHGERIVLRILDKSNVILGLDKIGMPKEVLRVFRKLIRQSQGIILVTGPTGSGKTTTLYSAISEINSSEVNIMTVEDPVEYKLPGMAQIGVNPKIDLTFAKGLRHILRQDPDVIMIGEVRDKETAEIAIQSSLTGHLVLTTLHTNDAPSALTRLVDMGIESYLLSSSVIGILAQRLVRKICPKCRVSYRAGKQEVEDLFPANEEEEVILYKGKGCAECFNSGYKGRHGIYELLLVTTSIKEQLSRSADASMLQRAANNLGMRTLRDEGAALVKQGITTSAEVLRVTRSIEI
ncbi:MAG: GspE/PulE family protein [Simkaniaceae bacterium]